MDGDWGYAAIKVTPVRLDGNSKLSLPESIGKGGYKKDKYLQYTAHPLEAVLFCGVRPLLGYDHNSLIVQDRHRKYCYPEDGDTERRYQTDP